jgi:hypothetical protein
LSSFAPEIAFGAHPLKTAVRDRKVLCLGKCPLSCDLFGPIDIGQEPVLSQTIPQPACRRAERASGYQILLKEKPEGFDTWLIKSREKTTEAGMAGKRVAAKEGHERPKTLIKRFQGGFPTHRVSDEDDDKVNRVIVTKPGAGKPHPLLDGIQNAILSQDMGKNGHLAKP